MLHMHAHIVWVFVALRAPRTGTHRKEIVVKMASPSTAGKSHIKISYDSNYAFRCNGNKLQYEVASIIIYVITYSLKLAWI